MQENLILIFTRNPELGKVKTRLAASIGDKNALEIYRHLLEHTEKVVSKMAAAKRIMYSDEVNTDDIWDNDRYQKQLQSGADLGVRMKNAFKEGFVAGFKKAVIIGTDLHDLEVTDLEKAFEALEKNDIVIGPALDGGYYLLGLKFIPDGIFDNKNWGTNTVLSDTLMDIKALKHTLLEVKNDIDTVNDIKEITAFKKYIPIL